MQNETKSCQNCKKDFTIEPEDFSFYEKIKVPAPTWCPECRLIRRLSFGNAWGVHFRNCDKCENKVLTMYDKNNPIKVYCDSCWWADDWDGTEYGVDYDPNKNFFKQWKMLRDKTPHFAKDALYTSLINCEYTNAIAFSKNCYMTFWADYCENVYYSAFINGLIDCVDIFSGYKNELCYDSVGIGKCNKVYFSNRCDDCIDVWFSRNCYGCSNCFGCVNLRNKKYCIFNEQFSKDDYFKKIEEFKINTRDGIRVQLEKSKDFWEKLPYREYIGNSLNVNVSGDYIYDSKNAKDCYMCNGVEDSKYTQFVSVAKATNCMDYYGWGNQASLLYECATSGEGLNNIKFSFGMFSNGMDSEYCGWCTGSQNNFGCSNLKKKQYCILNKQYTKEEYFALREKIIKDMNDNPYMDDNGRIYKYGEFFPTHFSPFPYQDSNANKFFPKNKNQIINEGYRWDEIEENIYKTTIKGIELPSSIEETTDDILNEVIECVFCFKAFKIITDELNMYKKLNIPIPEKCFNCREKMRFELINMPNSYESNCAKCGKNIKTMHDPKFGRIIYCEKCYQQEVY